MGPSSIAPGGGLCLNPAMIRETTTSPRAGLWPLLPAGWLLVCLLGGSSCRGPILPQEPGRNLALWLDRKGASRKGRADSPARRGPSKEQGSPPREETSPGKKIQVPDLPPLTPEEARKRRKEAEALLSRALRERDPSHLPRGLRAIYNARTARTPEDLDSAAVDLQDRLARDPGDFLALAELGTVRLGQGAVQEALALEEKALRRAPRDPGATLVLAQALAARGRPEDLVRSESLLKSIPAGFLKPGRLAHLLYRVYMRMGKPAEAVRTVSLALEKNPGDYALLGDQIQGLIRLGRLEEALQVADRLTRPPLGPLPEAFWYKGFILRRLGRFGEAASTLLELARGKGPDFEDFFSRRISRQDLAATIGRIREEERAGRRLYFLPGEREEILRTDPDDLRRLQVVQSLARSLPKDPFKLLDLALSDRSPTVRAAALQVLGRTLLGTDQAWERIKKALGDQDPRVRGMAAHMVGRFHRPECAGILLSAMEKEKSGYAFKCMNDALQDATGKEVLMLGGEEESPKTRSRVLRAWKELLKK